MSGKHAAHSPVDLYGSHPKRVKPPRHVAYVTHAELIPERVPCCSPDHPHPMVEGGGEPLEVGVVHYLEARAYTPATPRRRGQHEAMNTKGYDRGRSSAQPSYTPGRHVASGGIGLGTRRATDLDDRDWYEVQR